MPFSLPVAAHLWDECYHLLLTTAAVAVLFIEPCCSRGISLHYVTFVRHRLDGVHLFFRCGPRFCSAARNRRRRITVRRRPVSPARRTLFLNARKVADSYHADELSRLFEDLALWPDLQSFRRRIEKPARAH